MVVARLSEHWTRRYSAQQGCARLRYSSTARQERLSASQCQQRERVSQALLDDPPGAVLVAHSLQTTTAEAESASGPSLQSEQQVASPSPSWLLPPLALLSLWLGPCRFLSPSLSLSPHLVAFSFSFLSPSPILVFRLALPRSLGGPGPALSLFPGSWLVPPAPMV